MVTLDQLLDVGDDQQDKLRDTGRQVQAALRLAIIWIGWAAAKIVLGLMYVVAAPFWLAGYITARVIVPAGKWSAAAFAVGYEQGKHPRRT